MGAIAGLELVADHDGKPWFRLHLEIKPRPLKTSHLLRVRLIGHAQLLSRWGLPMAFQVMSVSLGGGMTKCKLIVFMALIDNSDQLALSSLATTRVLTKVLTKVLREAACAA